MDGVRRRGGREGVSQRERGRGEGKQSEVGGALPDDGLNVSEKQGAWAGPAAARWVVS